MPTQEGLFTKLSGGDKFTKLDLSNAYQQVVIDEESQPYVTHDYNSFGTVPVYQASI